MYLAWSTKVHKNIALSFLDENILKPVNTIQNSENHVVPPAPPPPSPLLHTAPPPHAYKSSGSNTENKQKKN